MLGLGLGLGSHNKKYADQFHFFMLSYASMSLGPGGRPQPALHVVYMFFTVGCQVLEAQRLPNFLHRTIIPISSRQRVQRRRMQEEGV